MSLWRKCDLDLGQVPNQWCDSSWNKYRYIGRSYPLLVPPYTGWSILSAGGFVRGRSDQSHVIKDKVAKGELLTTFVRPSIHHLFEYYINFNILLGCYSLPIWVNTRGMYKIRTKIRIRKPYTIKRQMYNLI